MERCKWAERVKSAKTARDAFQLMKEWIDDEASNYDGRDHLHEALYEEGLLCMAALLDAAIHLNVMQQDLDAVLDNLQKERDKNSIDVEEYIKAPANTLEEAREVSW